jgi:hemerythrin-like domain-containing protein
MNTIIDTLVTEHTLLRHFFDEINRLLPDVKTLDEIRLLTRLVEGLLSHHANTEEDLAFATLDHALAEKDQLKELYQDHQEIDSRLHGAALATEFPTAVRLLKAGLRASRDHFRREERTIFPLFDELLSPAAMEALGAETSTTTSSALRPRLFANALRSRLRHYTAPAAG